jgi:hypothetical protein
MEGYGFFKPLLDPEILLPAGAIFLKIRIHHNRHKRAILLGWHLVEFQEVQLFLEVSIMKKYLISIVAALAVSVVILVSYSLAQDQSNQRQAMTEEERAGGFTEMRERFQNMTEEERAAFRELMRARFRLSREDLEKAVKAIEEQMDKLKATIQVVRPQGGIQKLSVDERAKLRESVRNRRTALQAIIAQVALLQGLTQPEEEGAQFIIINTADLKSIYEMAEKEKATETAQLLSRMAVRVTGRGLGGRQRPGGGQDGRRGNQ